MRMILSNDPKAYAIMGCAMRVHSTLGYGFLESAYGDADEISGWAKEAFSWAVGTGVISGKGNGRLDPKGTAKRSEVAQIVMNYNTKVR